ncbi:TonB-dependent receptor [Sphingomonas gellani]|uniref:TonB-dependent receptor n=1 Tax=Sphingomonas gellani TaxID=1166340 RepID=A0A1H8IIZ8_9SPHN|nr:TonB-dependent receptor [Sphingomonas gellani]SEN68840.1 TonB-dependent receptor [Sphingomonas gellani]
MRRISLRCALLTTAALAPSSSWAQADVTPSAQEQGGNEKRTEIVEPTGTPGGTDKTDVVVVGIRGSVASAANKKKNGRQIVDSVVSEDVGKLPDNNVPEALSRVTGVQITRERGQGQSVAIRGLGGVQTTINGNDTSLGEGRSLNLADIPAELLKAVDVYKTRTADQVEGSIAGTVNVELRRPLDMPKGWTIAGSAKGIYDDISEKVSPYGSLLVANRFQTGIGEIGFLVNGSWTRNNYKENYIESESPDVPYGSAAEPNSPRAGLPAGFENTVIPYRAYYGLEEGRADRPSLNVSLQWRANDNLDFVLEGGYLGARSHNTSDRLYLQTREAGYRYSNITLQPDGRTARSLTIFAPLNAADPNAGLQAGIDSLYERYRSNLYTTNFEMHWRSDRAQLNTTVQYNWSNERRVVAEHLTRPYGLTSATVDFASDAYSRPVPSITFNGVDLSNVANYGVQRYQDLVFRSHNREFATQTDLTLTASETGLLRTIQTGVRFNRRDPGRNYGYRDGFPRIGGQFAPLTQFPGGGEAELVGPDLPGALQWYRIPGNVVYGNRPAIRDYIQANDPGSAARFATEEPSSDLGQIYTGRENRLSFYGQLSYAFDLGFPIDGLIGARYTNTWGGSSSYNFRPGNAANGFQDIVEAAPARGNYQDILPNATATIHFTDKAQLRLSYTTNVQRPSFYDLRPFYFAETRAVPPIIFAGNPNLKAQREHAFDASAEYYFGRGGQLTLAGYYKKASGFLYYSREVAADLAQYGLPGQSGFVEQQRNAGDGTFIGMEATGQTFFDFLPGILRNFGVSLNASRVFKARIEYPYPEDFPGAFDSVDTSKWTANAALFYDTPKFSSRVAFNYRSPYRLYVWTNNPAYSWYNDDTYRLDAAINYTPVKFMTLSVEGTNLLGNDVYRYFGQQNLLPLGVRTLARTVQGSVRFRF